MYTYQGKTALVTGASSGIGKAMAYALATRGMNLILVARSEKTLNEIALQLAQRHNVRTEVIAADLIQSEAVAAVQKSVQERELVVDLLVNDAGFGSYGHFETLDPQRDHDEVMLNAAVVVDMSHAFLPAMVARGEGAIINISSTGAFQPGPYMAVYGASKAFVLSFSVALWAEYRTRGIRVVAVCPGPVDTQFFNAAGPGSQHMAAGGKKVAPEGVVAKGLSALERGQSHVVPGGLNIISSTILRLLPLGLSARMAERALRA